jgi:hypothetical protein
MLLHQKDRYLLQHVVLRIFFETVSVVYEGVLFLVKDILYEPVSLDDQNFTLTK